MSFKMLFAQKFELTKYKILIVHDVNRTRCIGTQYAHVTEKPHIRRNDEQDRAGSIN